MALEMKDACESCGRHLDGAGQAWICSYECTWCSACAEGFLHICPNCEGELVRRPRRGSAAGA